jgi:hypothetical protein
MSIASRRSIKTEQLKMRELNIICTGNTGTPVLSGPDSNHCTVTDLGVGNYRINFLRPFELACMVGGVGVISDDSAVQVTAVAVGSVTVQVKDLANVAKEGDFSMCIKGTDARYYV